MEKEKIVKVPNLIFVIASVLAYKERVVIDFTGANADTALRLANHVIDDFLCNLECENKNDIYTISRQQHNIAISLQSDNADFEDCLKQYLTSYKNDKLSSPFENIYKWSKLEKNFRDNIDKDILLSSVKIDTVEHLPVIMHGYYSGTIDIIGMRLRVTADETLYTGHSSFKGRFIEDEFINNDFEGYSYTCLLDLTKYINNAKDKDSEAKPTNKGKYTKQQQKIYECVKRELAEGSKTIDRMELYRYCKNATQKNRDKALSKAICELNKRYMEINDIDRKLLECDNDLNVYNIIQPVM